MLKNLKNFKNCVNCNKKIPKIKKDPKIGIVQYLAESEIDEEGETKKIIEILTADKCYTIFQNITDEEYNILGFDSSKSRPEDLIFKYYPFPPIAIRPSSGGDFLGEGTHGSLLTVSLAEIVKANNRLRKFQTKNKDGQIANYYNEYIYLLQYHISTYFDNDITQLPKSE
jgi:DNA-directed RNA polymerase beta' subunit